MFKNYFNIAIAVLRRRKFFTFISLFCISITLAILMVLIALKDSVVSPNYPETKRDLSLYLLRVVQSSDKDGSTRRSEPSYNFLEKYVLPLKTPEAIAVTSVGINDANVYRNNKKLDFNISYTNAAYWNVMEFKFLEGQPFTQQNIDRSENVVVISDNVRKQYFGDAGNVTGKIISANNMNFRIVGVVKNVPGTMGFTRSDLYMPYNISKSNFRNKAYEGNFIAILLAKTKSDLPVIQEELANVISKVPPEDIHFNRISVHADHFTESFTRLIFGGNNDTGVRYFYLILGIFVFLFMLLPTINLVNINVSRIMERSSEIGVRKAFGASSGKLVVQFIFENVLLTFFGGILGALVAYIVISIINSSDLIQDSDLQMNYRVLISSFLLCLLFGFFSGVFPAWRMSRLNVAKALKDTP